MAFLNDIQKDMPKMRKQGLILSEIENGQVRQHFWTVLEFK